MSRSALALSVCMSSYNIRWNGNKTQPLGEELTVQGCIAPRQRTVPLVWTYLLMELGEYLFWGFLPGEGYPEGHHVLNDGGVLGEVQTCKLHQSGCSEHDPQSQKFLISEDALHLYLLLLQMEDIAHRSKIKQNCWIQILGWCQTWELHASEVTDAYSITTCKYGLCVIRCLVVFYVKSKLLFGKICNPFSTQELVLWNKVCSLPVKSTVTYSWTTGVLPGSVECSTLSINSCRDSVLRNVVFMILPS